jgi:DNA-binding response OmpR family regulator
MKIGLLEDNPSILDYMQAVLTMAGHEIYPHVQSGSLLQTLLIAGQTRSQLPYDMVVIDILLSGRTSGIDTIIQLRQRFPPEHLPIVVVSACSQAELAWVQATFPDVATLRKPFKISAFLQMIATIHVRSVAE